LTFSAFVIFIIAMLKGGIKGITAIYSGYSNTAQIVSNSEWNYSLMMRILRIIENGKTTISSIQFVMPALILGLLAPAFDRSLQNKRTLTTYAFGLILILAPSFEILLKRSYSYHIAQMLIGASIFVTYGLIGLFNLIKTARRKSHTRGYILVLFIIASHALLLKNYMQTMRYSLGWTMHFSPTTIFGDWSSPVVKDSYFLRIASLVRLHSQPDDRILSTSKSIYALAGRMPLSLPMADLGHYLLRRQSGDASEKIVELIHKHRPAVYIADSTIEHMSQAPKLAEQLDSIKKQITDIYESPITVGPGLVPYRQFSADVYFQRPK
jgi:uncharacterized membrane protein